MNVTLLVGIPPIMLDTVAVNVTAWPGCVGLAVEDKEV